MSSYVKTTIYGKLHQNLRGAVHLLCQMKCCRIGGGERCGRIENDVWNVVGCWRW